MKNLSVRLSYLILATAALLLLVVVAIGLVEDTQSPEVVTDISVAVKKQEDQKVEVPTVEKLVVNQPEAEAIKPSPIFIGEPGDHPHPITEEHLSNFDKNNLFADLLGALDIADVEGLRALSYQYQLHSPDEYVLQNGIDVIVNCLSDKTTADVRDAQIYYDTERSSRLRRYVRRFCFE